uniref:BTB domain-containing protein n=1 Tax=Heterorhabditis bacteriophora TaxID=37862 RepID=A0A1I7X5A5_HETBA
MGTEILHDAYYLAAPSNFGRPFKILVQDQTFLIDSEYMKKMSPVSFVFSVMCYGKDFEGGRELSREIVDEKCVDIDVFLKSVNDTTVINSSNFTIILRLSNKYQVLPVFEACENYIRRQDLDVLKPDEVMTLLIAAHEFHCHRDVMVKLIRRLAIEGNVVFARLKISRFLPAQIRKFKLHEINTLVCLQSSIVLDLEPDGVTLFARNVKPYLVSALHVMSVTRHWKLYMYIHKENMIKHIIIIIISNYLNIYIYLFIYLYLCQNDIVLKIGKRFQ